MTTRLALGSCSMNVSSATAVFPTDGFGGSSASAGAIFPINGTYLIEACTVLTAGAASTLTILAGDGTTTICTIAIPLQTVTGAYFPIGGLNGVISDGLGMSAKISAGSTVTLWFRKLLPV